MADLFDDLLDFLGHDPAVELVGDDRDHTATETARLGAVLTVPVVLSHFDQWAQGPIGSTWLKARVPAIDLSSDTSLSGYVDSQDHRQAASAALGLVLGDRRAEVSTAVAAEAAMEPPVIDELMGAAAWGVLVCLAHRFPDGVDRQGLAEVFAEARTSMAEAGWQDWIASTTGLETIDPGSRPEPEPARSVYPPPVSASRRQSQASADEPASEPLDATPMAPLASSNDRATDDGSLIDRRRLPILLGLGAAAVIIGLVMWSLLGNDDDAGTAAGAIDGDVVQSEPADTSDQTETATDGDGDAFSDSAMAESDETDTDDSDGSDTFDEGLARLVSAMEDPLEVTEASGTSLLTFDRETGEICYDMTVAGLAEPYDGHIHVGPVGVKGGIIVDFGELSGAPSGCLQSTPTDIESILGDLSGHYVELHDASGVGTIRAQLAEASGDAVATTTEADGGAYAIIGAGTLHLVGDVPDQETIDKYLESFADVDLGDTELINELQIVEGAPRPSGRILVDDLILFEVNSDRITNPDSTVLRDLATLLQARPAWRLTVVGHTDSTGPDVHNLELSLNRAEAVRAALIDAGVSPTVLTVNGAGSTDPIDTNETAEGRANNRRIELAITPG